MAKSKKKSPAKKSAGKKKRPALTPEKVIQAYMPLETLDTMQVIVSHICLPCNGTGVLKGKVCPVCKGNTKQTVQISLDLFAKMLKVAEKRG